MKLTKQYMSLFGFFSSKFFFFNWLDEKLYPEEKQFPSTWKPNPERSLETHQFLGGFQPFLDMSKDFVDTFKSYKTSTQITREILQPLRGAGNLAKGIVNIIAAPLLFLANTIRYAHNAIWVDFGASGNPSRLDMFRARWRLFGSNMKLNAVRSISWLIDGVASVIRGATQVVTSPLVYLAKMPLRGLITAIKGFARIEENKGMKRIISKTQKELIEENNIITGSKCVDELHRKFTKAHSRKQYTGISKDNEEMLYGRANGRGQYYDNLTPSKTYFGLFRPSTTTQVSQPEEETTRTYTMPPQQ